MIFIFSINLGRFGFDKFKDLQTGKKHIMMKRVLQILLASAIVFFGWYGCVENAEPEVFSEENTSIEYLIEGTGDRAVVFIHCWSCDKTYWNQQVPYFAGNYKVVTIDLPGHGESEHNRTDWSIDAFGKDVASVVEALDLKQVVLVGHSMGGSVILAAAKELGDRVMGLIGVDTFQDFETEYTEDQFAAYIKPFEDNFTETTIGFVMSMFPPSADSVLVERIAKDMSSAPEEVALGSFRGLFKFKPLQVLEQVNAPIYGINADMYPVNIEAGKKHASKFEIRIMKGYGHFLNQEDPEKFNTMLEEILEEIYSG
jgi:pimeloyl-ACP methyl ester carboxylesterase